MRKCGFVIVGGGLSGLTAAAYLSRKGDQTLLLEKSDRCGGLVQTFDRDGFRFDTGPRAFLNSGILLPMLEDLGIALPLAKSPVSTGIRGHIVHSDDDAGTGQYLDSLLRVFPSRGAEIRTLGGLIRSSRGMVRALNAVPNPYFRDPLMDLRYLLTTFIPWLPSFLYVALKTGMDRRSVEDVLDAVSDDQSFKDMVSQHFFKGTPYSFALGYRENFGDYVYPPGGTSGLPRVLEETIRSHGGQLETEREIVRIIPARRILIDQRGEEYSYNEMLWAADLKSLYDRLDTSGIPPGIERGIEREKTRFGSACPGESVFTLFLAVDEPPGYFGAISRGHFIYTPRAEGLGPLHRDTLGRLKENFPRVDKGELRDWIRNLCALDSYEISIPALRDPSLAPEGKTGLVVSILFDGELCEMAIKRNLMDELTEWVTEGMIAALDGSIYPGLRGKMIFLIPSTPVTLMKRFNTAGGAITGWSLEGKAPVASSLPAIRSAVRTKIPHVFKAGQWSYSPSGVPVAILTGRIAAARMSRRPR